MFHAYDRKTKSPHSKPLKDLTAIVSPEHLLAEPKRKELVQKLLENSAFEPTRFESLCGHLIHHFIHYAQTLPETSNSYYSQSAGLVDHALNRTEAAISLFKDYVLQDNQAELSE